MSGDGTCVLRVRTVAPELWSNTVALASTAVPPPGYELNVTARVLTGPSAIVFTDDNGQAIPDPVVTKRFNYAQKRCRRDLGLTTDDLRQLHGVHGLRHTAASIMILRRLSLPYIAQILGHSVKVLTEVYAHIIPPADGCSAADVLDSAAALPAGGNGVGMGLALTISQGG